MGQGSSPLGADFWSFAHTLWEALVQVPQIHPHQAQMDFVETCRKALQKKIHKAENYCPAFILLYREINDKF